MGGLFLWGLCPHTPSRAPRLTPPRGMIPPGPINNHAGSPSAFCHAALPVNTVLLKGYRVGIYYLHGEGGTRNANTA